MEIDYLLFQDIYFEKLVVVRNQEYVPYFTLWQCLHRAKLGGGVCAMVLYNFVILTSK